MIDLIGDIHGHADKLEELLLKLDYKKREGVYSHPNRKVLFVGGVLFIISLSGIYYFF